MQVCTSLQTGNQASTPLLSFYRPDALPAAQPQRQSATEITLNILCARHVPVHSQAPPLVRCTPRRSSWQLYSEDLRAAAATHTRVDSSRSHLQRLAAT